MNSYVIYLLSIFTLVTFSTSCSPKTERKGVVIDRQTRQPLAGVAIELYRSSVTGDTLRQKVVTDSNGRFHIQEARSAGTTFLLSKEGYIDLTSSLPAGTDTVEMERMNN